MTTAELQSRVNRLVAQRVKAIIVETFAVRNGTPRVILGDISPAWILERAANCTIALLGDEFLHITSKVPAESERA